MTEPSRLEHRVAELEAQLAAERRERAELEDMLGQLRGLATILDEAPDAILTVDAAGTIVWVSATAVRVLGVSTGDAVGELFDETSRVALDAFMEQGWAGLSERHFSLRDGHKVSVRARARDGLVDLYLRDVTAWHALDEASGERRRMAALAQLAGAIARELNDPMSIVQGRLELLLELDDDATPSQQRHLGVALEHARRISATLRNLRLVGRTAVPRLERVSLVEVVEDAVRLVGPRLRRVEFSLDLAPGDDLAAGGDAAMLSRVFANLLAWILDSLPRGGSVVVQATREGDEVVVSIDGGSGRVPLRLGPRELSGFGLSIARTLVTSLGGRFEASPTSSGVRFDVYLAAPPAARVRQKPAAERVLVVGSEPFSGTVRSLIARDGFDCHIASSGRDALDRLADGLTVDAVVTELILEGISGLTLAEEALRDRAGLHGRVIVVSDSPLPPSPLPIVSLCAPLRRLDLLEALGRRVRRR